MIEGIQLTAKSMELLQRRNMSKGEIGAFQALLNEAQAEMESTGESSREVLQQMDDEELALLQKAASLAAPIRVDDISEEGAANLLLQPDNSNRVDLNHDGIVEVGAARSIVIPPVDAPDHVKAAWDEATEGMSDGDYLLAQAHMMVALYGISIEDDGPPQLRLSPEQQWSTEGIAELFATQRSALEFKVGLEGWTRTNVMMQGFYNRLEQALA